MLRPVLLLIALSTATSFSLTPSCRIPLRSSQRTSAAPLLSCSLAPPSGSADPSRRAILLGVASSVLAAPLQSAFAVGEQTYPWMYPGDSLAVPLPKGYEGPLPSPSTKPEQVVDQVLKAVYTVDKPGENYGLKVAYAFTSDQNLAVSSGLTRFRAYMDKTEYKFLFGGYDKCESRTVSLGDAEGLPGVKKAVVYSTLTTSSPAALMKQGMPPKFIKISDEGKCEVTVVWKLTKSDGTNDCWLYDTVFIKPSKE